MKLEILNITGLKNNTSLNEGKLEYQFKHDELTKREDLEYRLWLHYLECRNGAGRRGTDFNTFKQHTTPFEYVHFLRSSLIYTDDIVTEGEIEKIFFNWK